ncbi:hypothetical protein ABW21_db0209253 [Orbilia brochopaga]|nr:hypothetical protein ABW21_db0209253 [Drechslerella brochopaga]
MSATEKVKLPKTFATDIQAACYHTLAFAEINFGLSHLNHQVSRFNFSLVRQVCSPEEERHKLGAANLELAQEYFERISEAYRVARNARFMAKSPELADRLFTLSVELYEMAEITFRIATRNVELAEQNKEPADTDKVAVDGVVRQGNLNSAERAFRFSRANVHSHLSENAIDMTNICAMRCLNVGLGLRGRLRLPVWLMDDECKIMPHSPEDLITMKPERIATVVKILQAFLKVDPNDGIEQNRRAIAEFFGIDSLFDTIGQKVDRVLSSQYSPMLAIVLLAFSLYLYLYYP